MKPLFFFLLLSWFIVPSISAQKAIELLINPPGTQRADFNGLWQSSGSMQLQYLQTETFDSATSDVNNSLKNFTSAAIKATYTATGVHLYNPTFNNKKSYGSYDDGNFLEIGSTGQLDITFSAPVLYFGMLLTAIDDHNVINLYSGSSLIESYTSADIKALLPKDSSSTYQASNGLTYQTTDYYGQATSGHNTKELYAYLNFIATGDTSFDRVVLVQGKESQMETDSHSIVLVDPVQVPEPGSLLLVGLGLLMGARRRR